MSVMIKSGSGSDLADVNSDKSLLVSTQQVNTTAGVYSPSKIGGIRLFSENDSGTVTGSAGLLSPETDKDFRLRISTDAFFDDETFNYTAQNTGKHQNHSTTMTFAYGTGGLVLNGSSITTTTTGVGLSTYAYFPFYSSGISRYDQFEASFSAQPVSNTLVDVGPFIRSSTNPYAPTDGAYFRLTSAGMQGVINHNGTETATSVLSFSYVNNRVYRFLIVSNNDSVQFWIDDVLYGEILTPVGQGQPFMANAHPFSIRQAIVGGAAGGVLQTTLRGYGISYSGGNITRNSGDIGNGVFGSYQGLSGGTMGSLASYANSANPTAAVATNTTSAILTALGGQGWETDTLAVNTDGIIMSYQVPAGTVSIPGKRLKLNGVKISSYVQTALTGGGYNSQYALCFGHTAVSLATAEAATTKAPRRVALGSRSVAAGAVALTQLADIVQTFSNPIYVNPGEFIAIARKRVGTAASAGVIAHTITLDYSWE